MTPSYAQLECIHPLPSRRCHAVVLLCAAACILVARECVTGSTSVMADTSLQAAVNNYFAKWNAHDVPGLEALFTPTGELRDWDVSVSGAANVAAANANIFAAVPHIRIEVLSVFVDVSARVATAEILVHVGDNAKTVLKVVDVISFDAASTAIKAVRAYKG